MRWYPRRRDLLVGLLVYGSGDTVAAILAGSFDWGRMVGMAATGGLLYAIEIPNYFRWVARITAGRAGVASALQRAALAIAYFNPLWIARHLALIALFSGAISTVDLRLLAAASHTFLVALPVTLVANLWIQNGVVLRHRFYASAVFSCLMAIFYPLVARSLA